MNNTDDFIKVVLAVYRVTELFPEEEVLRLQIRELANSILADSILLTTDLRAADMRILADKIDRDVEAINLFFAVARERNLADHRNFLVLSSEYAKIKKLAEEKTESFFGDSDTVISESVNFEIGDCREQNNGEHIFAKKDSASERKKKVLQILKEKKKIQLGELAPVFPQVSRRTIIRDMEELLRDGLVERDGGGRAARYALKD